MQINGGKIYEIRFINFNKSNGMEILFNITGHFQNTIS